MKNVCVRFYQEFAAVCRQRSTHHPIVGKGSYKRGGIAASEGVSHTVDAGRNIPFRKKVNVLGGRVYHKSLTIVRSIRISKPNRIDGIYCIYGTRWFGKTIKPVVGLYLGVVPCFSDIDLAV